MFIKSIQFVEVKISEEVKVQIRYLTQNLSYRKKSIVIYSYKENNQLFVIRYVDRLL